MDQIDPVQVASRIATSHFFATERGRSATPTYRCATTPGPAHPVPRFTVTADSLNGQSARLQITCRWLRSARHCFRDHVDPGLAAQPGQFTFDLPDGMAGQFEDLRRTCGPIRSRRTLVDLRTPGFRDTGQGYLSQRANRIRVVPYRNSQAEPTQIPHISAIRRWLAKAGTNAVRHR